MLERKSYWRSVGPPGGPLYRRRPWVHAVGRSKASVLIVKIRSVDLLSSVCAARDCRGVEVLLPLSMESSDCEPGSRGEDAQQTGSHRTCNIARELFRCDQSIFRSRRQDRPEQFQDPKPK